MFVAADRSSARLRARSKAATKNSFAACAPHLAEPHVIPWLDVQALLSGTGDTRARLAMVREIDAPSNAKSAAAGAFGKSLNWNASVQIGRAHV